MCGIAGVLFRAPSPSKIVMEALSTALARRGPDGTGFLRLGADLAEVECAHNTAIVERSARLAVVHRRLAILDLSDAGLQPMASADGNLFISFNGEIYNYLELRRELEASGHVFRTSSDTEVLLAALTEWGVDALARLEGMFAFSCLFRKERRVLLVRDPFGIKPLYYAKNEKYFAFASSIQALLAANFSERRLNPLAALRYLRFGTTDVDSFTMVDDIRIFPPASYAWLDCVSGLLEEPRQFWSFPVERAVGSETELMEELRAKFFQSVQISLRSDVPYALALSGGVDSSAICCVGRKILGTQAGLRAFSFISKDARSEERWVDLVSARCGVELTKITISTEDVIKSFKSFIEAHGEPVGSANIFAQFVVFRTIAASGVKVLLEGQGGDEMLAGYNTCVSLRFLELLRQLKLWRAVSVMRFAGREANVKIDELLGRMALSVLPQFAHEHLRFLFARSLFPDWLRAQWFQGRGVDKSHLMELYSHPKTIRDELREEVYVTSLPHLLRYGDSNSMFFSVENRVPFLNRTFADACLSLPSKYLVDESGRRKAAFRSALAKDLPFEILNRHDKIGFDTPQQTWLNELRDHISSRMQGLSASDFPLVDLRRLVGTIPKGSTSSRLQSDAIWRVWNLIEWSRSYGIRIDG